MLFRSLQAIREELTPKPKPKPAGVKPHAIKLPNAYTGVELIETTRTRAPPNHTDNATTTQITPNAVTSPASEAPGAGPVNSNSEDIDTHAERRFSVARRPSILSKLGIFRVRRNYSPIDRSHLILSL